MVGHIDLVGTPQRAEPPAPVPRDVQERGLAVGPLAHPQPETRALVDYMRQPAWTYHWKPIRSAAGMPDQEFYELKHRAIQ